jgi:hypothetical protein
VFIVLSVYFVIDSVRKLLDTPSYFYQTKSASSFCCVLNEPAGKKEIIGHGVEMIGGYKTVTKVAEGFMITVRIIGVQRNIKSG